MTTHLFEIACSQVRFWSRVWFLAKMVSTRESTKGVFFFLGVAVAEISTHRSLNTVLMEILCQFWKWFPLSQQQIDVRFEMLLLIPVFLQQFPEGSSCFLLQAWHLCVCTQPSQRYPGERKRKDTWPLKCTGKSWPTKFVPQTTVPHFVNAKNVSLPRRETGATEIDACCIVFVNTSVHVKILTETELCKFFATHIQQDTYAVSSLDVASDMFCSRKI